jgi:hypothetical protein
MGGQEDVQPVPSDVDIGPVLQLDRCFPDFRNGADRRVVIDVVVLADPARVAAPAFETSESRAQLLGPNASVREPPHPHRRRPAPSTS